MRETILSNCEKKFVLSAIAQNRRLDGRSLDENRELLIHFGNDWGLCHVSLGETKVLCQVTCDVQPPKATRPNEGLLFINVELSPMAAQHFEVGRQSELNVHINRVLEKCIKESRCVDLESLCIVADEKVWNVRVDMNVLNADGNILGCCSIAALSALAHFRHPDVTTTGDQITIHSPADRDPIPISLHHFPVAIVFAIFNNGLQVVADPTYLEERVSEAELVLGVNAYRELCGMHLGGAALAQTDLVACANRAAKHAATLVYRIKAALEFDEQSRSAEGSHNGLADCIRVDRILGGSRDRQNIRISSEVIREALKRVSLSRNQQNSEADAADMDDSAQEEQDEIQVISDEQGTATTVTPKVKTLTEILKKWEPSGGVSTWTVSSSDEEEVTGGDDGESDAEVEVVKTVTLEDRVVERIELSGESEEEETVTLNPSDMDGQSSKDW